MRKRRLARHQLFAHVGAYGLRVALQRVAPAAPAAGAHDRLGLERDRNVGADHWLEFALAREPHEIAAGLAGQAAPEAPRRTLQAPRLLKIPAPLDQVAHAHVDAEPATVLAGAAGI